MNQALARTSLYYAEGSSSKEYHAEIVTVAGGNVVNFRYGRRGGTLTSGTKTAAPVDFAQAKRIYDKLVKEKTTKGYTPDVSGAAYQSTERAGLKSDFSPQLLNAITEAEVMRLIQDDRWAAQQKMDGERRAAHADGSGVFGINRKGLVVPLPQIIVEELQAIHTACGSIRVDGELIGNTLHVFDLHIHQGIRLHPQPWLDRMRLAQSALDQCQSIKAVPFAVSAEDKLKLWNKVRHAQGEGVVFKRVAASVSAGRSNTGGDWLKFKFTESSSCCVTEVNSGKRSVKLGLMDTQNRHGSAIAAMIPVGNVTIPPNHDIPAVGDIVEVEYLYAYPGGSLFQPVYRGKRDDIDRKACTLHQLKHKPDADDDEEF